MTSQHTTEQSGDGSTIGHGQGSLSLAVFAGAMLALLLVFPMKFAPSNWCSQSIVASNPEWMGLCESLRAAPDRGPLHETLLKVEPAANLELGPDYVRLPYSLENDTASVLKAIYVECQITNAFGNTIGSGYDTLVNVERRIAAYSSMMLDISPAKLRAAGTATAYANCRVTSTER